MPLKFFPLKTFDRRVPRNPRLFRRRNLNNTLFSKNGRIFPAFSLIRFAFVSCSCAYRFVNPCSGIRTHGVFSSIACAPNKDETYHIIYYDKYSNTTRSQDRDINFKAPGRLWTSRDSLSIGFNVWVCSDADFVRIRALYRKLFHRIKFLLKKIIRIDRFLVMIIDFFIFKLKGYYLYVLSYSMLTLEYYPN